MFKIYKCEVRDKKDHIVKNESTTHVHVKESRQGITTFFSSYDLHRADRYYKNQKKVNGKIAGDYTLYYYNLKDIESGKLFSMKTEHNIELDGKPLYIGVEGEDIIAFSRNELSEAEKTNNKNNYTIIESKTSHVKASEFFYSILMCIIFMIPILSLTANFAFIKDGANAIKEDYKNYPALIVKILIGLVMAYQIKMIIFSMGMHSLSNWYQFIQGKTISTGLLSLFIILGSIGYFKLTRIKNLEKFKTL